MNNLAQSWRWFCDGAHTLAISKGWWEKDRSFLEVVGMVVSELGEVIEAFRSPRGGLTGTSFRPSAKILAFSQAEEELADIVIRLADLCQYFQLDLSNAPEFRNRASLFDACCVGTNEDRFSCCFDVLLDNPMDEFRDVHGVIVTNPVERVAIVSSYLGEAILSYLVDKDELSTECALGAALVEICLIASEQKFDLGEAILAKHAYNASRPYRHGNKVY